MADNYTYTLTRLAAQEIDEVIAYISEKLHNVKAANDLQDKIEQTIEQACVLPYGFPDCEIYYITDEKVRHVPIDNYVLIYEIYEEKKQISILRFRYAKMDLEGITTKQNGN